MADPLDPFGDLIAPLPPPAPLAGPAPVPTPVAQDPHQRLATIAALAAAIAGGQQSGLGGLAAGLQRGQQQQDQANLLRYQAGERARQEQNRLLEEQQNQASQQEAHRQATVQSILADFQKRMPTFQNASDYEQQIGVTGNMLRGLVGSRLNDQVLRARYPYTAPKIETLADKALTQWMALPSNKRLLERDPEAASKAVVMFDRDGDGIPERTPLLQLAELAKKPFAQTADGMVASPAGTTKADVANADAIYRDLLQQATAAGKQETPELRNQLRIRAQKQLKEAQSAPEDIVPPERVAATATAILEKRMAPSQLTLGGGMGKAGVAFKQAVMAEVNRQNPNFNWQEAEANYQFARNTGTQTTIRFLDNIEKTLPVLEQASKDFKRSGVRVINRALLAGKSQFGNTDVVKFEFARNILADEIAKILQGGGTGNGTSDAKLRQAQDLLAGDMTPEQFDTAIGAARELLSTRRESLTKGTFMERPSAPEQAPTTDLVSGRNKLKSR